MKEGKFAKSCLFGNGHCYFSSKSFLNFGRSGTKFLMKWFIIKKTCTYSVHKI